MLCEMKQVEERKCKRELNSSLNNLVFIILRY
jgi:hypothetical protein